MLSLTEWYPCRIRSGGLWFTIENAAQPIAGGMSGSPVVLPDGRTVALVSTGGGLNPGLPDGLPFWLARALLENR